jgi:hypothetical protein
MRVVDVNRLLCVDSNFAMEIGVEGSTALMNVNENSGIKSYPLATSLLHYHIPCDVACCFQIFESTPISIAKFESTHNNRLTSTTLIK